MPMWSDMLKLLAHLLPCERRPDDRGQEGEHAGGGPAGGEAGGEPAAASTDDAHANDLNAQLQAAQERIAALEKGEDESLQDLINQRAEERLFELVPEVDPSRVSGPGGRHAGYEPYQPYQTPGGPPSGAYPGDTGQYPGEELTEDQKLAQRLNEIEARQRDLETARIADSHEAQMRQFQEKYPHMDPWKVTAYLANLDPEVANRIDVERLAKASHERELRAKMSFAEEHHQRKLEEIRKAPQPPPVPGAGEATPNEGLKIDRSNASRVLAERLAASGFGRGR